MFIKLLVLCFDLKHVAIVTNEGKGREKLFDT